MNIQELISKASKIKLGTFRDAIKKGNTDKKSYIKTEIDISPVDLIVNDRINDLESKKNINISGNVNSVSDLPTSAKIGESYVVGTTTKDLYICVGENEDGTPIWKSDPEIEDLTELIEEKLEPIEDEIEKINSVVPQKYTVNYEIFNSSVQPSIEDGVWKLSFVGFSSRDRVYRDSYSCNYSSNKDQAQTAYQRNWAVKIDNLLYAVVTGSTSIGIYSFNILNNSLELVDTISIDSSKISAINGVVYAEEDDTLLVAGVGSHCLLILNINTTRELEYRSVSDSGSSVQFMHMDIKNKDFFALGNSGTGIEVHKDGVLSYKYIWMCTDISIIDETVFVSGLSYGDGIFRNYYGGVAKSEDYGQTWTAIYNEDLGYSRFSGVYFNDNYNIFIVTDFRGNKVLFFDTEYNLLNTQSFGGYNNGFGLYALKCVDSENSIYISSNKAGYSGYRKYVKLVIKDNIPQFEEIMVESISSAERFFDVCSYGEYTYLFVFNIKPQTQKSFYIYVYKYSSSVFSNYFKLWDIIKMDSYKTFLYCISSQKSVLKSSSVYMFQNYGTKLIPIKCWKKTNNNYINAFSTVYVIDTDKTYNQIEFSSDELYINGSTSLAEEHKISYATEEDLDNILN